jgi:hypothetical protein
MEIGKGPHRHDIAAFLLGWTLDSYDVPALTRGGRHGLRWSAGASTSGMGVLDGPAI